MNFSSKKLLWERGDISREEIDEKVDKHIAKTLTFSERICGPFRNFHVYLILYAISFFVKGVFLFFLFENLEFGSQIQKRRLFLTWLLYGKFWIKNNIFIYENPINYYSVSQLIIFWKLNQNWSCKLKIPFWRLIFIFQFYYDHFP